MLQAKILSRKTFELIMIKNRQWHRVSLVVTLRKVYYLILKGQGQNSTSSQGHVMTEIGHVAYHSTRFDRTNAKKPSTTFYLSSINSYWHNTVYSLHWPPMTFQEPGLKRTLIMAAVPNHHDFNRFGMFICVHTDIETLSFFSIDF